MPRNTSEALKLLYFIVRFYQFIYRAQHSIWQGNSLYYEACDVDGTKYSAYLGVSAAHLYMAHSGLELILLFQRPVYIKGNRMRHAPQPIYTVVILRFIFFSIGTVIFIFSTVILST